jgi:hypothetical protein
MCLTQLDSGSSLKVQYGINNKRSLANFNKRLTFGLSHYFETPNARNSEIFDFKMNASGISETLVIASNASEPTTKYILLAPYL